jgi:hypothetical protein
MYSRASVHLSTNTTGCQQQHQLACGSDTTALKMHVHIRPYSTAVLNWSHVTLAWATFWSRSSAQAAHDSPKPQHMSCTLTMSSLCEMRSQANANNTTKLQAQEDSSTGTSTTATRLAAAAPAHTSAGHAPKHSKYPNTRLQYSHKPPYTRAGATLYTEPL